MLKDEKAKIADAESAARFIRAIIEHAEPEEMLNLLTNRKEYGKEKLHQALLSHDGYASEEFLLQSFLPLLRWFNKEEFSRGVYKRSLDELLCSIVCKDAWLAMMQRMMQRRGLGDGGELLVGWMITQAVCAEDELGQGVRESAKQLAPFMRLLAATGDARHRKIAETLQDYLFPQQPLPGAAAGAGASSSAGRPAVRLRTVAQINHVAGGRHDNDFEQFRDIRLLPTAAELQCPKEPYLPLPSDVHSSATLLDRAFRLLRHDFVCSVREEFAQQGKNDRRRIFSEAQVEGFESGLLSPEERAANAEAGRQSKMRRGVNKGYFVISFKHSAGKENRARKAFWEDHPRFLQRDALVCFVANNQLLCFAVVCERDSEVLGSREPSVGVVPCSQHDCRSLVSLMIRRADFDMVQCQASFFSVEHVLRGLKRMQEVPFAEELVAWKQGDKC